MLIAPIEFIVDGLISAVVVEQKRILVDLDETALFNEIIFEVLEGLLNIPLINKLKLILFIFDLRFEDWHVEGSVDQVYMFDVLYAHK